MGAQFVPRSIRIVCYVSNQLHLFLFPFSYTLLPFLYTTLTHLPSQSTYYTPSIHPTSHHLSFGRYRQFQYTSLSEKKKKNANKIKIIKKIENFGWGLHWNVFILVKLENYWSRVCLVDYLLSSTVKRFKRPRPLLQTRFFSSIRIFLFFFFFNPLFSASCSFFFFFYFSPKREWGNAISSPEIGRLQLRSEFSHEHIDGYTQVMCVCLCTEGWAIYVPFYFQSQKLFMRIFYFFSFLSWAARGQANCYDNLASRAFRVAPEASSGLALCSLWIPPKINRTEGDNKKKKSKYTLKKIKKDNIKNK